MSQKLQYIKQEQPKFIKQFKAKAGMKEEVTIDEKRLQSNAELDDRSDNEDEKPVVVVLNESNLTKDEAEKAQEEGGKIKFNKPASKRPAHSGLNATTKKTKLDKQNKKKTPLKNDRSSKKQSSNLLSFNDDLNE